MLSTSTPPTGSIPDQAGIQKVLDGFAQGWNLHDVKIFSQVFAEDADFTNVMGMSRHGREAIEEIHEPGFKGIWANSTLIITKSKTRIITNEVAAVDAWWDLIGSRKADGSPGLPRTGLLNFIMVKDEMEWRILVMHNMDLPGSTAQSCVSS